MATRPEWIRVTLVCHLTQLGEYFSRGSLIHFLSSCSLVAAGKCGRQEWFAKERLGLDLSGRPVLRCDRIDVADDRDIRDFVLRDVGFPPTDDVAVVIPADYHLPLLSCLVFRCRFGRPASKTNRGSARTFHLFRRPRLV